MDNNHQSNPQMDWDSRDLNSSFQRFKEHAKFMFKGPLSAKTEEVHCNYLMLWVGDKGRQIYSTWNLSKPEKKKLKSYYDKFEVYCKPKSNIIFNRQSRYVGRSEPDQSFSSSDDSNKEDDENTFRFSNFMNLPTQSYKTAEYLGMRSGYSVSREESPEKQTLNRGKRRQPCPVFEDEIPVEPFSKLPHPNDLFGKRARIEHQKMRKEKINPVDNHIMQLHQKQAKLIQVQRKCVQESENQGNKNCNINSQSSCIREAVPVSQHATFSGTNYSNSINELLSQYPSLEGPTDIIDNAARQHHFQFSFNHSKSFEE